MKPYLSSIKYLAILATLFISASTVAEDYMGEEAVKALVVGNTIHA